MEILLYLLLPITLTIYGIGLLAWVGVYCIEYLDSRDSDEGQEAAQRLLKASIWPIVTFGIFLRFVKELKMVAKGEEK